MASQPERPIRRVSADWADVVLVCRKCSRKLGGGFGRKGKEGLADALRRSAWPEGSKKARRNPCGILDVGCLDICPKRAVVVVRAAAPAEWLVVAEGTPVESVARDLGLARLRPP